jgi:hypothetical protein
MGKITITIKIRKEMVMGNSKMEIMEKMVKMEKMEKMERMERMEKMDNKRKIRETFNKVKLTKAKIHQ